MATLCFGEEETYFLYGDLEALCGFPLLGIGARAQRGVHGVDVSANLSFLPYRDRHIRIAFFISHIKGQYLFYPWQEGFYCGGGLGILTGFGCGEGTVGYQWKLKNQHACFLETNVTVPFPFKTCDYPYFPAITFGFSF